MEYKDLLRDYISNSGLSLSKIAERLTEYGFNVGKSYISQLQNGKGVATDELNRALATITGGDVASLLAAAYLTKAPPELKDTIQKLFTLRGLRDEYDKAELDRKLAKVEALDAENRIQRAQSELQRLRALKESGVSHVCRVPVLDSLKANVPVGDHTPESWEFIPSSDPNQDDEFVILFQNDDSMVGDRINDQDKILVRIQNHVNDGEIAIVNVDGNPSIIRRVKVLEGQMMLLPSNPKFEPILVPSDRVQIRGKVIQVIFDPNHSL